MLRHIRCARVPAVCALIMLSIFAVSCRARVPDSREDGGRLKIIVSIMPQAYFVQRIGVERVKVDVLARPGQSPETYEVSPRQMDLFGRAQLYFRIGMPFENALVPKITAMCPQLAVVDLREGVSMLKLVSHHDPDGAVPNTYEAQDPHIWLDPGRAKIQAQTIEQALSKAAPAFREEFAANLSRFIADLEATDLKIRKILTPYRGRRFHVFHPAYGYFADAYGLIQVPVEEGGKEPGARYLNTLVNAMKAEGARVLCVQPQYSTQSAKAIAEATGARIISLDPLAEDYLANLEVMARELAQGLGEKESSHGAGG